MQSADVRDQQDPDDLAGFFGGGGGGGGGGAGAEEKSRRSGDVPPGLPSGRPAAAEPSAALSEQQVAAELSTVLAAYNQDTNTGRAVGVQLANKCIVQANLLNNLVYISRYAPGRLKEGPAKVNWQHLATLINGADQQQLNMQRVCLELSRWTVGMMQTLQTCWVLWSNGKRAAVYKLVQRQLEVFQRMGEQQSGALELKVDECSKHIASIVNSLPGDLDMKAAIELTHELAKKKKALAVDEDALIVEEVHLLTLLRTAMAEKSMYEALLGDCASASQRYVEELEKAMQQLSTYEKGVIENRTLHSYSSSYRTGGWLGLGRRSHASSTTTDRGEKVWREMLSRADGAKKELEAKKGNNAKEIRELRAAIVRLEADVVKHTQLAQQKRKQIVDKKEEATKVGEQLKQAEKDLSNLTTTGSSEWRQRPSHPRPPAPAPLCLPLLRLSPHRRCRCSPSCPCAACRAEPWCRVQVLLCPRLPQGAVAQPAYAAAGRVRPPAGADRVPQFALRGGEAAQR